MEIGFGRTSKYIVLRLFYQYEILTDSDYTPEYREYILNWQDQIKLLNSVKDYKIEKQVSFVNKKGKQGGNITLKLPNLNL